MWRRLTIRTDNPASMIDVHGFTWEYRREITQDSEALHMALAHINPGDEYTVTFENMTLEEE